MNKTDDRLSIFQSKKRASLAPLNTPIETCERIKTRYPELPNLFIKRDDMIGPLVWGNKLRKLEYSFAEAIASGCDTVITFGGIQSNHARITAQVARRLGLHCELVLNGDKPAKNTANFLINNLMGVPIHFVQTRQERDLKMNELARQREAEGRKVYKIPLGASDSTGSYGFVNAFQEVVEFEQKSKTQFDYIIHGCSSGGTQAGLIMGKQLFNRDNLDIIGVSADDSVEDITSYIMKAAAPMLKENNLSLEEYKEAIQVDVSQIGEGYGIPTPLSKEVGEAFAECEGILLDQTYTAKGLAAIISKARQGFFKPSDNILFWHTGGTINLFK